MHKTPTRTKFLYLILKLYAQRKLRTQVRNATTEPPDRIGIFQYSHSEDRQRTTVEKVGSSRPPAYWLLKPRFFCAQF